MPLRIAPKVLKYEHNLAKEREKCAAILGEIASSYTILESHLAMMFVQIANISPDFGHAVSDITIAEAFDSIAALDQKIEMILIAARRRFDNALVDDLEKILKGKIREAQTRRNRMIHARWLLADEYPDAIIYQRRFASNMEDLDDYDETKLQAKLDLINNARKDLTDFYWGKIVPALRALRQ